MLKLSRQNSPIYFWKNAIFRGWGLHLNHANASTVTFPQKPQKLMLRAIYAYEWKLSEKIVE